MATTTKKYHVGKNGPAECKATKRACRYGGANTHYHTMKEAEDAYKKQNNFSNTIITPAIQKQQTITTNVSSTKNVIPPISASPTDNKKITVSVYEKYIMMQKVDVNNNNNKFYELIVEGKDLIARWGRVGATGRTKVYKGMAGSFNRMIAEKEDRGYKRINIVKKKNSSKGGLREAALEGLLKGRDIPEIRNMVNHLVDNNIHKIGEFSGGKLQVVNGNVSGPLGLVTMDNLNEAQKILHKIIPLAMKKTFATMSDKLEHEQKLNRLKEQYMTLVPQAIGMSRSRMYSFLTVLPEIRQQQDFINQLKAQVELADQLNDDNGGNTKKHEFRYNIDLVTDKKEINRLEKKFKSTGNSMHGSLNSAKIMNVYSVEDSRGDTFKYARENVRNVQELWHGSRSYNILSILNNGLVTPDNLATAKTAGAMFGNGLYFSNQSTKSAQYSRGGRYSIGTDKKFYMILADVAMGYEYRPGHEYMSSTFYDQRLKGIVPDAKGKKYNSINVKSGHGGVVNHEAIVPSPDQVKIKYIIELES